MQRVPQRGELAIKLDPPSFVVETPFHRALVERQPVMICIERIGMVRPRRLVRAAPPQLSFRPAGGLLDVDRRSVLDADQHRHYAHSPCHSECDAHCKLAPNCGTAELYRTQPLADPSHPSGPPGAVRQPNRAMNLCDRRDPASRSDKVHPSHQISWRKVAKANGPLRLVFWAAFSLTDRRSA